MQDVSMAVEEDVPIVSVLDVQQVADQRIPSHTLHKVLLSLFEVRSPALLEESEKGGVSSTILLYPVQGLCVRHKLDQAGVIGNYHDLIGLKPELQVGVAEDFIDTAYELHREELLAQVIMPFNNHHPELPTGVPSKWRGFPQSFFALYKRFAPGVYPLDFRLYPCELRACSFFSRMDLGLSDVLLKPSKLRFFIVLHYFFSIGQSSNQLWRKSFSCLSRLSFSITYRVSFVDFDSLKSDFVRHSGFSLEAEGLFW
mmetsp:Transcript_7578/g.14186  ORF Transcript_7578/g.14186 Transcript_7578/m.14186 type:complete len:256 (-) Transcript_7578:1978-2745(-)